MPDRRVKVLALAGDPGGAEAIAPVISALKHDPIYHVDVYSYRQATALFARHGLESQSLSECISTSGLERLLKQQQTEIVLCATSVNGVDLEKRMTIAAKQCEIATLSVVDFWSNYGRRYSDASLTEMILPNKIAVPNEKAKSQMILEGFPADRIVVTGQPALDRLLGIDGSVIETAIERLRQALCVSADTMVIVFASQPLSDFYGGNLNCLRTLGYTEFSVFQLLLEAVEILRQSSLRREVRLIVQPHPREDIAAWKRLQIEHASFVVDPLTNPSFDVCLGADIVVGMTSILLLEMGLVGKHVLSVEPKSKSPQYYDASAIDIFTEDEPHRLATAIMNKARSDSPMRSVHTTATARVVAELKNLADDSRSSMVCI